MSWRIEVNRHPVYSRIKFPPKGGRDEKAREMAEKSKHSFFSFQKGIFPIYNTVGGKRNQGAPNKMIPA